MMTKSATKVVLVAHRESAVRERFAAALAEARHECVAAATADEAMEAATRDNPALSLALLDIGLPDEPDTWIRQLRTAGQASLPVLVFAGTVGTSSRGRALIAASVAGYISEYAATPQILPALAPHLFPASFNRRLVPRSALSVPVTYRSGTTIAGAVTLDIGRGGMAIRTLSPLAKGSTVLVRFRLPPSPDEIERSGLVVWSDQRVGMGIQFERELDE